MNYKIGDFIEQLKIKNGNPNHPNVSGINILKQFMPSKNVGADTSKYLVVPHNSFACNLMHVGRDERIPIAMNAKDEEIVVSSAYFVFQITKTEIVLPEYLNMIFQSSEFDRYAWFCTDASIRGNLDWTRFCDIDIDLPPLEIQEKYVAVYKSFLVNQQSYENGLEDLKLVCNMTIEKLRREMPSKAIGPYIEQVDKKNEEGSVKLALGVDVNKDFIPAKRVAANVEATRIVEEGQFAYNKVMKANGTKLPIALRKGNAGFVSGSYFVFKVKDKRKLIPEYLMMWLSRPETERYAGYISWGSTRDVLSFETLGEIKIPVPDIYTQKSIVDIYNAYKTRRELNEKLKAQIKEICPILINGAKKEANSNV
ncbi:restriction endonuclease subunit S [Enterococcus casseliflavus]